MSTFSILFEINSSKDEDYVEVNARVFKHDYNLPVEFLVWWGKFEDAKKHVNSVIDDFIEDLKFLGINVSQARTDVIGDPLFNLLQ